MDRREFLGKMGSAGALAGLAKLVPKESHAVAGARAGRDGGARRGVNSAGDGHAAREGSAPPEEITLAGLGDCILTRKVSERRDVRFLELVDLLRSADCTWGNCEILFVEPGTGYPSPTGFAMHVTCEPWGADELAWLGVDFVGLANNHTMDYGNEGLFATLDNLERVGIPQAGAGHDLQQASRAGYCDTPGGRVGQVSCDASAPAYYAAAYRTAYTNGRPGANVLGVDHKVEVGPEMFEELRGLFHDLGGSLIPSDETADEVSILTTRFVRGAAPDFLSVAREGDVKRITGALGIARRNSRLVIQSIHSHQGAAGNIDSPAPYHQPFARACIDAGADVYFNTGPHTLRGIELYKGKPIFYSLGNFLFQYETIKQIDAETNAAGGLDPDTLDPTSFTDLYTPIFEETKYWESVVPYITYRNGSVKEIELYPVVLGVDEPRFQRGTPVMATKEEAKEIIERLGRLSLPFGTAIECRDGVGVVRL